MKTNNKFLKWMKKGENWIPFTVFGGILTAVILSWMTIFFVEYGAYFNEDYQKSLFKRSDRKEDGPLLETEYVYIDGELTWSIFSSFGFKLGDIVSSYSEITDENGNGQLLEIDYDKQLLRVSKMDGDKTTEISTEPAPSRPDFMGLAFDVDLPVGEMSFKPKMSNISVFKKDNALVSYASMPSDKSYPLHIWGISNVINLSNVSLSCQTVPWAEEEDRLSRTSFQYQIRGAYEGKAIEINRWLCWSYANFN